LEEQVETLLAFIGTHRHCVVPPAALVIAMLITRGKAKRLSSD